MPVLTVDTTAPSVAADNRRRAKRDVLIARAQYWESGSPAAGEVRIVWVHNISLGGVSFRSVRPIRVGAGYIRVSAGPLQLEGRVRVMWCRRRDEGVYESGVQFAKE